MSFRDEMYERLDVDKNGKVQFADVVRAAEEKFGVIQVQWGFGGFCVGVVLAFVLLKVVL